ncbi:FKBP-type peptidyl-prolyl cis-trans isomerase [Sunxiuqinia sp. A32]|uniref:FKBP-type peptidyl-prolyl cis-trans isomerase n=1 Tax=Sunxiuqinia sp. A32 TaxID=3461496 RepID=UPI004045DF35
MKFNPLLIALISAVVFAACQPGGSIKEANLATDADSASYAIGVLVGEQNKQNLDASPGAEDFNTDIIISAFVKSIKGEETQMTSEDARAFIQTYFQQVAAKEGEANKAAGAEFLAQNKTKEGVIELESGLQYEVLTEGTGLKPTADQSVKCHYHGTLIDGTVFDSSVERGEPSTFGVSQVIPGWTEALQLMPVGSKWKLYIPADLAYGDNPRPGGAIKPGMALIFEVELLEIIDKE